MAKTKIVVIQLKEIIYTVIFAALGILLILLLIFMFKGGKDEEEASTGTNLYTAGTYSSTFTLNDMALNMVVVVDKDHINNVSIENIDEAITTMYPLIEPSLEAIALQLYNDVSINDIEFMEDSKYTQLLLVEAIQTTLDKAKVTE
ncbi:MAG: putative rane protein [Herbinix sp.]|nr:putative rane protein [Herbinix sp.]